MTTRKPTGRPTRKTTETPGAFHESVTDDPANLRYSLARARANSTVQKGRRRG